MTIKQHGGVFGRNPSFNEVEAGDGAIKLYRDASNNAVIEEFAAGYMKLVGAGSIQLFSNTGEVLAKFVANGQNELYYNNLSRFKTTVGGVEVTDGDLKFADGHGIDFSATSGTGTSELFDDYEEGTWTPGGFANLASTSITPGAGATYAGSYTKIGNVVTCYFDVNLGTSSTSVALGDVWSLTGLPYASSGDFISGGGVLTVYGSLGSNILAQIAVSTRSTTTYFRPIQITGAVNYAYPIRGFFSYKV